MFENYQKINIKIDCFDVSYLTFVEMSIIEFKLIFAIISKKNYQF